VKEERTELSVRLDAGGVCIQTQGRDVRNVARIRLPKGAESGHESDHRERAQACCDTAIPLG